MNIKLKAIGSYVRIIKEKKMKLLNERRIYTYMHTNEKLGAKWMVFRLYDPCKPTWNAAFKC